MEWTEWTREGIKTALKAQIHIAHIVHIVH